MKCIDLCIPRVFLKCFKNMYVHRRQSIDVHGVQTTDTHSFWPFGVHLSVEPPEFLTT